MTDLMAPIAVLVLAGALATLIRGTEGASPSRAPLGRRIAVFAGALLAIYVGPGDPGGRDRSRAIRRGPTRCSRGGWIALPLALAIGALSRAARRRSREGRAGDRDRPRDSASRSRAPAVRGRALPARGLRPALRAACLRPRAEARLRRRLPSQVPIRARLRSPLGSERQRAHTKEVFRDAIQRLHGSALLAAVIVAAVVVFVVLRNNNSDDEQRHRQGSAGAAGRPERQSRRRREDADLQQGRPGPARGAAGRARGGGPRPRLRDREAGGSRAPSPSRSRRSSTASSRSRSTGSTRPRGRSPSSTSIRDRVRPPSFGRSSRAAASPPCVAAGLAGCAPLPGRRLGPRARRPQGPAGSGLALRLGRLARPDHLLRAALGRLDHRRACRRRTGGRCRAGSRARCSTR